mgnify:CR=1 FL=1|jgi:uncharacterized membrane protein
MESKRRSIARVISWRITATITTMIISYFITGNVDMALKIGVIEVVAKMTLQYVHERFWTRLSFGLYKKTTDYNI